MTTKTNNKLNTPNNQSFGNLPIWDLSDLYDSIESKKITSDLEFIETKAKEFAANYEGKINLLNGPTLLVATEQLEIIDERMDKILSFAHLLYAENVDDVKNKVFFQQMQEKLTKISSLLIFFTLELNSIEEKKINELFIFEGLKKFKT
ncbi:uncharacterized protein METZ01_LOCUS488277, partial [marine metagenome]